MLATCFTNSQQPSTSADYALPYGVATVQQLLLLRIVCQGKNYVLVIHLDAAAEEAWRTDGRHAGTALRPQSVRRAVCSMMVVAWHCQCCWYQWCR